MVKRKEHEKLLLVNIDGFCRSYGENLLFLNCHIQARILESEKEHKNWRKQKF